MRRVLGIDPSLTSTGLATLAPGGEAAVHHIATKGRRDETIIQRNRRISDVYAEVMDWTNSDTALAVIEGPSVASIGGSPWDRAGLWWRIVTGLLANDTPVAIIAPSCRAKWATGSGSAGKAAVAAAMQRRFPTVEITRDDEADALALAAMGAQHLDWGIGREPTTIQRTALAAAKWPEEA